MKIKAVGKYVCLRMPEEKEEKKGNLYLPETAKKRKEYAFVVDVGDQVKLKLNVGDMVVVGYNGKSVSIDDVQYVLIEEDSIMAVVSE